MAPCRKKSTSVGRRYKKGTHGKAKEYDYIQDRPTREIGHCNNYTGRAGKALKEMPSTLSTVDTSAPVASTEASAPVASTEAASLGVSSSMFSHQPVDFSKNSSNQPLNFDAYAVNKYGKQRSLPATRKAQQRDVSKITTVINSIGDDRQRALALHKALIHPSTRSVASLAVRKTDGTDTDVANFNTSQIGKVLSRVRPGNGNGNYNKDVAAFSQSLLVGIAPSPAATKTPSKRQQVRSLGLPWGTGWRILKKSMVIRQQAKTDKTIKLAKVRQRKGSTRVTARIIAMVHDFIHKHEFVVDSPIMHDTLKVFDATTGKKTKVLAKLLLQISIRELHNDLVAAAERGDLPELLDSNGRMIISDTRLRSILPPQLRRATQRHKQMCGCEVCLVPRSHQQSLNAFRCRHIRTLQRKADDEFNPRRKQQKKTSVILTKVWCSQKATPGMKNHITPSWRSFVLLSKAVTTTNGVVFFVAARPVQPSQFH